MNKLIQSLGAHKKIFGIFGLLVAICVFTGWRAPESFLTAENIENTVRWTAIYGIISIGAAFVIMTGGIDLSIGSVLGLIGCLFAMSVNTTYVPQDLVNVQRVDDDGKTLVLAERGSGATPISSEYKAGDSISYLNQVYTIDSVGSEGQRITLKDAVSSKGAGGARRVFTINELSAQSDHTVGVGGFQREVRDVVIAQAVAGIQPEDQIELFYKTGLSQLFTVREVNAGEGTTTVQFLVRPGQTVRLPDYVGFAHRSQVMPTALAILGALAIAVGLGWIHGMLITKVPLQPFVVTLCGLLIYRGLARYITLDQEQGFGSEFPVMKELAKGSFLQLLTESEYEFDIPMPFVYMSIIGLIAAVFMNRTIYGRYILALGSNEQAAKFSGINTDRTKILAYMVCSFCAGVAAILFALDVNSVQPAGHGESYELYAIAAAVLGGCSLRGGEGSILGVIIAAAVIRVLNNAINLLGISTTLVFAIIGSVILIGAITDEVVRRTAAKRRAAAAAKRALEGS